MFDRQAKFALYVASGTLVICGIGFYAAVTALNYYLKKEPVELREPLESIPRRLGPWEVVAEQELSKEIIEELGTEQFLDWQYERRGERDRRLGGATPAIGVHIAYYTGLIDTVPHVADRCLVAGGWNIGGFAENVDLPVDRSGWTPDERVSASGERYKTMTYRHATTGRPVTVRMPLGELELRASEFTKQEYPGLRLFAGYFFVANGGTTAHPEGVRMLAFDLRNRYAYYCKIQFTMVAPASAGREVFIEHVADLMDRLLPELMRCLPDWAEVEQRSEQERGGAGV